VGLFWFIRIFISMKEVIKKLLRESLLTEHDFGYRAGNLIDKPEHKLKFSDGGRGTGHFGTGFYFFGSKEQAEKYGKGKDREGKDRVTHIVDFSMYKLAKGTHELHNLLKYVNDSAVGYQKDDDNLRHAIKRVLNYFNFDMGLEPEYKSKFNIRNQRDYDALTPDELKQYELDTNRYLEIKTINRDKLKNIEDDIINYIHNNHDESPSTVLMKYIGYEGIDVRGTDLDNAVYGSVIYDIKKDSVVQ